MNGWINLLLKFFSAPDSYFPVSRSKSGRINVWRKL